MKLQQIRQIRLTMIQLLQSGRKYSISELSDELEVSERMIRVYKEDLEKAKLDLEKAMQNTDYVEASRLQYSVIPELEKKIKNT